MIIKCPACQGPLKYDPDTKLMHCEYCSSSFQLEDLETPTEDASEEYEEMDCQIYRCSACGAELAVNGNETSTFCAYCGQPTIVFDRVSKQLKPRYILPFSITKEQAERKIRDRFGKGFFVPDAIKNFTVDQIRGIYIPYWTCDISYEDGQVLKGTVKRGKSSTTYYYFRHAEAFFERITLDASKQLNDESSQRLEPFDQTKSVPFAPEYLSGFYADRYDVPKEDIKGLAIYRAAQLFDLEVTKSVPADDVKKITSDPVTHLEKLTYVLMPAWFLTFRYQDEPYTILVNGQSGKVVGAVPFNKQKTVFSLIGLTAAFSLLFTPLVRSLFVVDSDSSIKLMMTVLFFTVMAYGYGIKRFKGIAESIRLSKAKATLDYMKERQDA